MQSDARDRFAVDTWIHIFCRLLDLDIRSSDEPSLARIVVFEPKYNCGGIFFFWAVNLLPSP